MGNDLLGLGPQPLYHIMYSFQMLSVKGVFHILISMKQFGSLWGRDEFGNPQSNLLEETSLELPSSPRNTLTRVEPP